jgi:hypothetical protein
MSRFEIAGDGRRKRLKSSEKLTAEDFEAIARSLGTKPRRVLKVGLAAACMVRKAMTFETEWGGEKTTSNAVPGDWIVTNLDRHGKPLKDNQGRLNQYVIKADRFPTLYKRIPGETEHGPKFDRDESNEVYSLPFPGGIDILAPWGKRQEVESGYLMRSGDEVYANDEDSFDKTYDDAPEPAKRS